MDQPGNHKTVASTGRAGSAVLRRAESRRPSAASADIQASTNNHKTSRNDSLLQAQINETNNLVGKSLKLFSDYSILRGEFLNSPNESENANTKAFVDTGLLDSYQDLTRFQERLIRFGKNVPSTNSADSHDTLLNNKELESRTKFLKFQETYDHWFRRIKSLRQTLEDMHMNVNGFFVYKSGVRFELIGNPEVEHEVAAKRKAAPRKTAVETVAIDFSDQENESEAPSGNKRKAVPTKKPAKRSAKDISDNSDSDLPSPKKRRAEANVSTA